MKNEVLIEILRFYLENNLYHYLYLEGFVFASHVFHILVGF